MTTTHQEARWHHNSDLQIMQIEEKRLNQIHDIEELRTGRLRIGGTHYVNAYILPEILKIYNEKYPGVQIELMEAGSNTLSRMLKERNIDITFSCDEMLVKQFDNYPAFEDHILLSVHESEPICSELSAYALEYDDISSKKHIDEYCPTVSMKKFEKIPFVLLTPGNNLYYRAKEIFLNYDINPDIKLEVSQLATAYHLSAVNYGSTFVSDRMIVSKEAPLKYFKLNSDLARRQFYALLKNQEYTPKAVKAFIMLIQDKFALI